MMKPALLLSCILAVTLANPADNEITSMNALTEKLVSEKKVLEGFIENLETIKIFVDNIEYVKWWLASVSESSEEEDDSVVPTSAVPTKPQSKKERVRRALQQLSNIL